MIDQRRRPGASANGCPSPFPCTQRSRGRVVVGLSALVVVCLLLSSLPSLGQEGDRYGALLNAEVRSPFTAVADRVTPAVVSIHTSRSFRHGDLGQGDNPLEDMFRQFFPRGDREFGDREFEMPGAGSGFVVSADGYVITNNHVVNEASEIRVRLPGAEESVVAELVGQDPGTDLAVLKIETDGELPHLRFGDSDEVRVGDWAIAIGNPLGQLEGSLTVGVISAKGRSDLNIQGGSPRYQDFMQTDAAINFGNSGGPLVDIHGDVIGVNTAINATGQNIGFAIPVNLASHIYEQLVENGRVIRGYLGVRMVELTPDLAEGRDLDVEHGVLVQEVLEGTPAHEGGIEVGDVIVEFNGDTIRSTRDLQFKVADAPVGSAADVTIVRDGRRRELSVVLVEYEEDAVLAGSLGTPDTAEGESWLGLSVAGLDDRNDPRVMDLLDTFGIEEQRGVLVLNVERGSAADRARLRAGDVIVEIVNLPIQDLGDYRSAVERFRDRDRPIAFQILRGNLTSFVTVDPREE